jgi:hypothetical protein
MTTHKTYGSATGPLGFPMLDKQAFALESILKALPAEDRQLRRVTVNKAPSELLDGERADVSWISTEAIDRDNEILIARGMNDTQFRDNPLVTLQHCYHKQPVGRSLWRKRVKDGQTVGIKAKTQYPPRPPDWADDCWIPDTVFSLVRAGLMQGKSVGFLRLKSHAPSSHEIAASPELASVSRIIDEWLLLEYACVYLPTNQEALVEAVSKGTQVIPEALREALGLNRNAAPIEPPKPEAIPFTSLTELKDSIKRRFALPTQQYLVDEALDRLRGAV